MTENHGNNFFLAQYFDWVPVHHCEKQWHRKFNRLMAKYRVKYRAGPFSGSMTSIEQRINIYHLASQVIQYNVPGHFVELGCYSGQTAVLLQKVIVDANCSKRLYVFDSFSGLPQRSTEDGDTPFRRGAFTVCKEVLQSNFAFYHLPLPVIVSGWFVDTLPHRLPESIAFAHLDGDFYESIKISLEAVYPRLSSGAACVIDDYCDTSVNPNGWNRLPGVAAACKEFLKGKPEVMVSLYGGTQSHAYFIKK